MVQHKNPPPCFLYYVFCLVEFIVIFRVHYVKFILHYSFKCEHQDVARYYEKVGESAYEWISRLHLMVEYPSEPE